jgi:hypothetical protein
LAENGDGERDGTFVPVAHKDINENVIEGVFVGVVAVVVRSVRRNHMDNVQECHSRDGLLDDLTILEGTIVLLNQFIAFNLKPYHLINFARQSIRIFETCIVVDDHAMGVEKLSIRCDDVKHFGLVDFVALLLDRNLNLRLVEQWLLLGVAILLSFDHLNHLQQKVLFDGFRRNRIITLIALKLSESDQLQNGYHLSMVPNAGLHVAVVGGKHLLHLLDFVNWLVHQVRQNRDQDSHRFLLLLLTQILLFKPVQLAIYVV